MRVFSGAYMVAIAVGCLTMLALASTSKANNEVTTTSPKSEDISPYSKQAQKEKTKILEEDYFSRKFVPEKHITDGEDGNNAGNLDGLNLEDIHSPGPRDASKPIDQHIRAAQKALDDDVRAAKISENARQNMAEDIVSKAGDPDSLKELVTKEGEKEGVDIKRTLTQDERNRLKYLTGPVGPGF